MLLKNIGGNIKRQPLPKGTKTQAKKSYMELVRKTIKEKR